MLKKLILNTAVQVFGKVILILISLITTSLLTRKLGVELYGSFILITSIFLVLDTLADFGTKIIGVRELSNKDDLEQSSFLMQLIRLRLIITTVSFLIGLVFILVWSGFNGFELEAVLALAMIFLTSIAGSLEIGFQTRLRMDLKVAAEILFPLLFLVALLFWPSPINLIWVFSCYLVVRIISLFLGISFIKKLKFEFKWTKPNSELIKKILKLSWPMGLYLIVFAGYDRAVDSIMIRNFVGIEQVAWYGLAYKIYLSLVQPAYFFVTSIFPLLSSRLEKQRFLFLSSFLILSLGLIVLVPVVYLMAPFIIQTLAGSEFAASVTVLRILSLALIFSYLSHLVGFTLISRGGQKEMLGLGLITLIFNVGLNIWAIPRFGITGAAGVTVATEAMAFLLMTLRLRQKIGK